MRHPYPHVLLGASLIIAACNSGAGGPSEPGPSHQGLTVRVSVPATTSDTAHVYIAGNFNGWAPGLASYRLTRGNDDIWTIELPENVRGAIEFKFTLGSWERVETTSDGADVPNRRFTVPAEGAAEYQGTVAGWKNGGAVEREHTTTASVSILDDAFAMPQLGRTRRVWLYLPPDYATSGDKRYPVLYMHDGQNVFDDATSYVGEWGVDETLDSLHAAGELSLIVVAVDHGGEHRFDEYNPWTHPQHGGGQGDEYAAFLVETLKPYIDAHYRTMTDRLNTGIAGSSMGGLISFYAMLEYPQIFGRAGVFSPAFWTAKPAAFDWAATRSPARPDPRMFMVSGGLEDGAPTVGQYELDQIAMADTLLSAGWVDGSELAAHVSADGQHSEWFWRREFPAAVQWLFEER